MAILVRKIARSKWPESICEREQIPADALADLRTTQNELSFWRVESDSDENLATAMLALAASKKQTTKIEKVSLTWISEEIVKNLGIKLEQHDGNAVVDDLVTYHWDACNLTYGSLGLLAEEILKGLGQDRRKDYTKRIVRDALVEAYMNDRVSDNNCKEELLEILKEEKKKREGAK